MSQAPKSVGNLQAPKPVSSWHYQLASRAPHEELLRDFIPLGMFVLMVLMLLGHTVFVSLLHVYARRVQEARDIEPHPAVADPYDDGVDEVYLTSIGIHGAKGDDDVLLVKGLERGDLLVPIHREKDVVVPLAARQVYVFARP